MMQNGKIDSNFAITLLVLIGATLFFSFWLIYESDQKTPAPVQPIVMPDVADEDDMMAEEDAEEDAEEEIIAEEAADPVLSDMAADEFDETGIDDADLDDLEDANADDVDFDDIEF